MKNCTSKSNRNNVRHELTSSFTSHILPPAPLTTSSPNCPLPTHPEASPYLMQLLGQTRQQLQSADGRHLLERGVSAMVKSLCESMRTELYTSGDLASPLTRRLVDCLPEMATWSKGIWNGIPDSGVEVCHLPWVVCSADKIGTSVFTRIREFRSVSIWGLGMRI